MEVYAWEPGEVEWAYLLALLPTDERERVSRFVFPDDQKRALVSRLMQRKCAQEALVGAPAATADVPIGRTKGGKPFVRASIARPSDAPNFNFNVSHEGAWVVLASEPLHLVGVDVAAPESQRRRRPAAERDGESSTQQRRCLDDFFSLMANSLSPAEWAYVRARPSERAREGAFRRLWSLKEAYVKARGDGLAFAPLSRAEFELLTEDGLDADDADASSAAGAAATLRVDGCAQAEWRFELGRLGDHWVSVAKGPPTAVIDAWGDFSATLARPQLESAGVDEECSTPSWERREVAALVPVQHADGYARARARDRDAGGPQPFSWLERARALLAGAGPQA